MGFSVLIYIIFPGLFPSWPSWMTPVAQETSKKTEISTLLNTFERKMKNIGEKQVALKPKEKAVLLLLASGMNI